MVMSGLLAVDIKGVWNRTEQISDHSGPIHCVQGARVLGTAAACGADWVCSLQWLESGMYA